VVVFVKKEAVSLLAKYREKKNSFDANGKF
jgi:hypothetical protein